MLFKNFCSNFLNCILRFFKLQIKIMFIAISKTIYQTFSKVFLIPSFFLDVCETCDCVSTYTQKSGVYRVVIAGDPKHVYCSFEGSLVWIVRKQFN